MKYYYLFLTLSVFLGSYIVKDPNIMFIGLIFALSTLMLFLIDKKKDNET